MCKEWDYSLVIKKIIYFSVLGCVLHILNNVYMCVYNLIPEEHIAHLLYSPNVHTK